MKKTDLPTDKDIREKARAYGDHIFWFPEDGNGVQRKVEEAFEKGCQMMRDRVERLIALDELMSEQPEKSEYFKPIIEEKE